MRILSNPYLVPSLLFILTFLSLTFRELLFFGWFPFRGEAFAHAFFSELPYSLTLILILLAHEMGHYVPARIYQVRASLPHFIPFPMGPVGTMGAVIQIKDRIPDKRKLFDIGVGGPLASLVLSVIAWIVGLHLSTVIDLPSTGEIQNFLFFGDSLFTRWSAGWVLGDYNPEFQDVQIHPLARAGWVGLLITAINLLPFGQLDGGHIIYAVFGERYRTWIYFLFMVFLVSALWNLTWLIWGFLIFYALQVEHPFVPDPSLGSIGWPRQILGIFMLLSLIFIFVPEPLILGSEKNAPNLLEYFLGRI